MKFNPHHYDRIAEAITYIRSNFKAQPNLDEVAEKINLSPFHFQRLFKDWAGVSPKKFLQYTSIAYAKRILKGYNITIAEAADEAGLSGTSRLHDLFVKIEGMTPGEFKNGCQNLAINFSFATTQFGKILVASTSKGICHMAFVEEKAEALLKLRSSFPHAQLIEQRDTIQEQALYIFTNNRSDLSQIKLHLKGTAFQLKVWSALLNIPPGKLSTYGQVAQRIQRPKASRAVGTAIGKNPIAFLIPCHRVIQSTGEFGNYMWGAERKTMIIGWEAAKNDKP